MVTYPIGSPQGYAQEYGYDASGDKQTYKRPHFGPRSAASTT